MEKQKILLTGATGFIGKAVLKKLVKKYNVICFIRNEKEIKFVKSMGAEIALGDILDKSSILRAMKKVNVVIHLATVHSQGQDNLNLIGSKNIIEACKEKKVKRFIFVSSMATKRKSLDDYGKTKLKIEEEIKKSGLNYTILRPTIVYSEDNLSLIGKSIFSIPFIIPIIGNGDYKLNPVSLKDIAEVIFLSVGNRKSIKKDYDLGGGEKLSFNDIIDICKKRFNIKKMKAHIPIDLCLIVFKFVPLVSIEAIKGINEDTNADNASLEKDFKINLIKFSQGVKNVNL